MSPVDHLYDEFYGRMHTGMAHAKAGRPILLPRGHTDRTDVIDSLSRLIVLYERLADSQFRFRRSSGVQLASATFQSMAEAMFTDVAAYACNDDPLRGRSDANLHSSPTIAVKLTGSDPKQSVGRSVITKLFWASASELAVPLVRAVCTARPDGAISMSALLAAALHLGAASRFEAVLGVHSTNMRRSLDRYST